MAAASNSSNTSEYVGMITRNMAKKLQSQTPSDVIPVIPPIKVSDKSTVPQIKAEDKGVDSASSTPHSPSSSLMNIAPVMTTNASSLEEQVASLNKSIKGLFKYVQEQETRIIKLMDKIDSGSVSQVNEKQPETQDEVETSNHPTAKEKSSKELQVSSDGMIPVDQLKEFIMGTIKDRIEGSSKSSLRYTKPYTQRIDNLKMPIGYQPPNFQQFDGKGNPKQHVAHFVETCNNAGTDGDHMVKQFVHSLKGNSFEWYTDLDANSIDS